MSITNKIRQARRLKRLSQKELANLANCTRPKISNIENGSAEDGKISLSLASRIAKILDIPICDLFELECPASMAQINKIKFKFSNGQKVRDKVTSMTGIITGSTIWLNGCIQYSVQPPIKDKDTKRPDSWWIDEAQLELINEGLNIETQKTGGPPTKSHYPNS